jgi:hypothetical protein
LKSWHVVRKPSHSPRGSSAGAHTPRPRMVCSQLSSISYVRLLSALCPTTALKMEPPTPESLCLMSALPPSGRRVPPPARTLLPGHGSYRLMRQSRPALPYFGLSLVRGVSAGCDQPLLLAGPSRRYLCESFPACLGPCHGGPVECTCLFLPPRHRPSPVHYRGRLPALTRQNDFMTDPLFETAAISLCSGPQVCSPPRSFLPLPLIAAGQPRLLRPS